MVRASHKRSLTLGEMWKMPRVMQLGVHNVIAQLVSESLIYFSGCLCNRINVLCALRVSVTANVTQTCKSELHTGNY